MQRKQFLEVGKITNVHGLHGEVKIYPWCDDAAFLCSVEELFFDGNGEKKVEVLHARIQQNQVIMKFSGTDTREQAELLRGQVLYLNREAFELEEGSYFIQDLIGLEVIDADTGKIWGKLKDVLQTGANDVYSIWNEEKQKEYLAPAIPEVILETNLDKGFMKIRPLKGLFEDAD